MYIITITSQYTRSAPYFKASNRIGKPPIRTMGAKIFLFLYDILFSVPFIIIRRIQIWLQYKKTSFERFVSLTQFLIVFNWIGNLKEDHTSVKWDN